MRFTINKYLPFALVYFFINPLGLPWGLLYTSLLAPFFYGWVVLKQRQEPVLPFIACFLPFIIAHIAVIGVNERQYAITMANLLAVYIFGQAFYTWLKTDKQKENILKSLLVINTAMCFLAIILYFTPWSSIFWIRQNLTEAVSDFSRLKMFTYEASHYALLFVPVFVFFLLQYILQKNTINPFWLLIMLFMPFVLSFSAGVIATLLAAGIICFFVHFRTLHNKRRIINGFINITAVSLVLFVIVYLFFRGNAFFIRLENIVTGNDTSASGRTADAFVLAGKLLRQGNHWWGIGAGQLNIQGADIIREYYLYYHNTPVAIPNAAAETLALFGWLGFIGRLTAELFFFAVTKPWKNYFRFILFVFVFIYQFTGSFITNAAEYVIWILAFTNAFPEFDVPARKIAPGAFRLHPQGAQH